jgi:hypothetical protein
MTGCYSSDVKREVRAPSRRRVVAARTLAIAVDFVQIALFPIFSSGAASPFNDALDLATATAMVGLVGWHWAFLPSFVSELVPFWDLVPTWTAAVFFATRGKSPPIRPGAIDTTLAGKDSGSKEVS